MNVPGQGSPPGMLRRLNLPPMAMTGQTFLPWHSAKTASATLALGALQPMLLARLAGIKKRQLEVSERP